MVSVIVGRGKGIGGGKVRLGTKKKVDVKGRKKGERWRES